MKVEETLVNSSTEKFSGSSGVGVVSLMMLLMSIKGGFRFVKFFKVMRFLLFVQFYQ